MRRRLRFVVSMAPEIFAVTIACVPAITALVDFAAVVERRKRAWYRAPGIALDIGAPYEALQRAGLRHQRIEIADGPDPVAVADAFAAELESPADPPTERTDPA